MRIIYILVLCALSLNICAQPNDILKSAQEEMLVLLNNIRLNYVSKEEFNFLSKGDYYYFKRDLFGSLYYFNTRNRHIGNIPYKLDKKLFYTDAIKVRLSFLLDNAYEDFEIEKLGRANLPDSLSNIGNEYRFNMPFVIWNVVMSSNDMLITKMIDNYNKGRYPEKTNILIKNTLAGLGVQPFKDDFIRSHTYDSTKSGAELADMLDDIYCYFYNKDGILLSNEYLSSDKQYSYILITNVADGYKDTEIISNLYSSQTSMWLGILNKDFKNKYDSDNWYTKRNREWMADWIRKNYKKCILEDDMLFDLTSFRR